MAQPILTPGRNWLGAFWTFVRTRLVADTPALVARRECALGLGALIGLGLAGALLHLNADASLWLIAPIGGSAIILFTLPHSRWPSHGPFLAAI